MQRTLGNHYLDLLRFFPNHRRFLRSEHPEREGKSPTQLLTRESHPHWLEFIPASNPKLISPGTTLGTDVGLKQEPSKPLGYRCVTQTS